MSLKAIYRIVALAALMLITSLSTARGGDALSCDNSQDTTFKINFRFDSYAIDPNYRNNKSAFEQLDRTIKGLNGERIDSIVITTKASPEGVLEHNIALARKRANSMRTYMTEKYPELGSRLRVFAEGEAWSELREFIANDTKLSSNSKARILAILDNETISVGTRKWRLERDPEYDYIYNRYYPALRNSAIYQIYSNGKQVTPATIESVAQQEVAEHIAEAAPTKSSQLSEEKPTEVVADEKPTEVVAEEKPTQEVAEKVADEVAEKVADEVAESIVQEQPTEEVAEMPTARIEPIIKRDTMVVALKSNMLYDALTVLNAEVEVPISRHFSVAVEYLFPWWESGNKYCLQLLELGVEGRYWFRNNVNKRDRLTGHFLGVYGMSAMYDIQRDYNPAHQGEFWSAGLTYGYAMRVGKQKRISLEFSLSVGYLTTDYRNYFPADDYSELYIDKLGYGRLRYFGPTKLKVSLVVPFNIGYNKKGGSR
ncbi:MAG: DUF3575 domain-containing protein [Alistipes sp.]|nr:DUF3575 domain-containing protein [Alistipes sp.]